MGRGKNKRKQQQPQPQNIHIEELEIESKVEIDYDKLALSIAKAIQLVKENEEQESAEEMAQWRKEMGYRDHDDKNKFLRWLFLFCNRIKVLWKIMFFSRKKHIKGSPTHALIQSLTAGLFVLIQLILIGIAVCFVAINFYHPNLVYGFYEYFICVSLAILSLVLSGFFRFMSIEVDQMSNREQVLGVFAAVVSIVQLVEQIVGLFRGVS